VRVVITGRGSRKKIETLIENMNAKEDAVNKAFDARPGLAA